MNRLPSRSVLSIYILPRRPATVVIARRAIAAYSSGNASSPKSAGGPSTTSGGPRSKAAVETGSSPTAGVIPDRLAGGDARGRTGGAAPLESSRHAPPQPKINNASVPGEHPNLTPEQQAEVDEHNRYFENKHSRAAQAADDKVDGSFWSGTGSRHNKE